MIVNLCVCAVVYFKIKAQKALTQLQFEDFNRRPAKQVGGIDVCVYQSGSV